MSKSPFFLAALLALGCGESATPSTHRLGGPSDETEDPGQTVLALVRAPAAVHCLKLSVTTAERVRQERFELTPGMEVPVRIGGLTAGSITLSGTAHDVACAQATRSNATWQTEALTVEVRVDRPTEIELVLHPVRPADVDVTFRPDIARIHVSEELVAAWDHSGKFYWNLNEDAFPTGPALSGLEALEIRDIAAGYQNLCAAHAEGVDCVGRNSGIVDPEADQGEVFDTPRRVVDGDFVSVAVGAFNACARRSDDAVVCWGFNNDQLIDDDASVWIATPRETAYGIDMHLSQSALCTLSSSGDVSCRGTNLFKELGVATDTNSSYGMASAILDISGTPYRNSYALRADGSVIAWGYAGDGALGNGIDSRSSNAAALPAPIAGLTGIVAVAGGGDAGCGIDDQGALWCWGKEVPDGTGLPRLTPQRFDVAGEPLLALSGAEGVMCGLHVDGAVSCWGRGSSELFGASSIAHFVPSEVESWSTRP
jgi:hypothetical protein